MPNVFHGKWICTPEFAALQPRNMYHKEHAEAHYTLLDTDPHNVHVLFRRSFRLTKQPGRYTLRISADDYGKYSINGLFLGQGPTPDYLENYQYNEFDITDHLQDGENEIIAHVYYQGLVNRVWISGDLRMGLIADILSPDGAVMLSTDKSWSYAVLRNYTETHKFSYDTQYAENYDSRVPIPEFRPVAVREEKDIHFAPKPAKAIQISERKPSFSRQIPDGIFYDFGQEITGTLRIAATGKAGERIRILCGEETDDSPVGVRYDMRCYCRYEEYWTLDDGENLLEQYDYKAFRYVALLPESPTTQITDLTAVVRHGPFDDDLCVLECDDAVLKQVFELCKNGVKYGTQEVYTDCPSREKGQYAGDMTVTSASQLWLTGDVYMLEKGIRAHVSSAKICKGFMAVLSGALMQEIADYSLQFPLLLLRHYSFTKDKAFLQEMLPYAEDMLSYFAEYDRGDGLLEGITEKWNLVDWPRNSRDGYDFELTNPIGKGVHNVINAFYIGATKNVEKIKDILHIPYENRSKSLAVAFDRVFLSPETGLYVDSEGSKHSSLHANILPAFYEFAKTEAKDNIAAFLKEKGMVCGVYMSYFYLRALCRLGEQSFVYDCITSTGENSWYNMIRDGATTCMEAWGKDRKFNTSFCHPWSSAPIPVLIEELLGVSYDGSVGPCHLPEKAGKLRMQIPTAKGLLKFQR